MTCYRPLKALVTGINPDTGKKALTIIGKDDFKRLDYGDGVECIDIPCGRCIGCRLRYSRIWADRCMAESIYHHSNLFITLTYNDDHLPKPLLLSDGTSSPVNPLVKRDVQLFIKRLRKKFPEQKIRYFLCGEYGTKKMRPHYHLILFGLELPDLKLLYSNASSFSYYTSKVIEELWYCESDPFNSAGFHIITTVNWHTCAYVARYVVKKMYGKDSAAYTLLNYPPEFVLMSRRPGIGRQFYDDHKFELYSDSKSTFLPTDEGARLIGSNKYYDKLYDLEFEDHFAVIRDERKLRMLVKNYLKSTCTDKKMCDILSSEEEYQVSRLRSLERSDCI